MTCSQKPLKYLYLFVYSNQKIACQSMTPKHAGSRQITTYCCASALIKANRIYHRMIYDLPQLLFDFETKHKNWEEGDEPRCRKEKFEQRQHAAIQTVPSLHVTTKQLQLHRKNDNTTRGRGRRLSLSTGTTNNAT